MSVLPSTPIPAGWYPDPAGSFQQRWWNGSSWTNDFAQYRPTLIHSAPLPEALQGDEQPGFAVHAPQQSVPTIKGLGSQQTVGGTSTLTREAASKTAPVFGLPAEDRAPLTSVARPNAGNAILIPVTPPGEPPAAPERNTDWENYLPFAPEPPLLRGKRVLPEQHPEQRYTLVVWILALLPAVFLGIAVLFALYLPTMYTTVSQVLLGLAFLIAGLGVAAVDRRALDRRGHVETASPAWSLLTPLGYLGVRAVIVARETGRGAFAPLVLMLVVLAAIAAAIVFVSGLAALLTANASY